MRALDTMSYQDFLEQELHMGPEAARYADLFLASACGLGSDAVSAYVAYQLPMPALTDPLPSDLRRVSFPGGNSGFFRYFLKRLIPDAIAGTDSFEDIITGPPLDPDRPTILTFYTPFHHPGLPLRAQTTRGRMELLTTSYPAFERQIYAQMMKLFAASGFDPQKDVAGLILNRWGHAYSVPFPGFFGGASGKGGRRGTSSGTAMDGSPSHTRS